MQINDIWIGVTNNKSSHAIGTFTLASDIVAHTYGNGLLLTYQQIPLVILQSDDLVFTVHQTWASYSYGHKVVTQCLRASRPLDGKNVMIEIIKA